MKCRSDKVEKRDKNGIPRCGKSQAFNCDESQANCLCTDLHKMNTSLKADHPR